jgi:hypothetical protein
MSGTRYTDEGDLVLDNQCDEILPPDETGTSSSAVGRPSWLRVSPLPQAIPGVGFENFYLWQTLYLMTGRALNW